MTPEIRIKPPYLHPSQRNAARHPARFRVLACGRRWGKTRLGSLLCIDAAINQAGRAWWVAPSYKVANVGWRLLTRLAHQVPSVEVRRGDRVIYLPNGGEIAVRSADNPDSLRGEGLDFVVMDECAFIAEAAWTEAIRPALSDRMGRAVFISTPKGRNWFWRVFQNARDRDDWCSWRLPTADNPYIDPTEIDAARRSLPEMVFRQEYLAEFVDEAGGVFRRVIEAATAEEQAEPQAGHQYVMGVDWAQQHDFTVIAVMDVTTQKLAYMDRFNQIDYNVQRNRLLALVRRFRPSTVIAEANSIGLPNIEALQRDGVPIQAFTTTNATKAAAIDALALAFETGDIAILNDPVLIGELQAYEQERTQTGLRRFNAPVGMHDDCVIALALAWQGAKSSWWTW